MFKKSVSKLSKFAKVALPVAAILALGYLAYAFINGMFPFSVQEGEGGEEALPVYEATEEAPEEAPEEAAEPPPLVIGISGDRIIYNDEEVTIEELSAILQAHPDTGDIWELWDVYRADRATYEEVRELLRGLGIVFRERVSP